MRYITLCLLFFYATMQGMWYDRSEEDPDRDNKKHPAKRQLQLKTKTLVTFADGSYAEYPFSYDIKEIGSVKISSTSEEDYKQMTSSLPQDKIAICSYLRVSHPPTFKEKRLYIQETQSVNLYFLSPFNQHIPSPAEMKQFVISNADTIPELIRQCTIIVIGKGLKEDQIRQQPLESGKSRFYYFDLKKLPVFIEVKLYKNLDEYSSYCAAAQCIQKLSYDIDLKK